MSKPESESGSKAGGRGEKRRGEGKHDRPTADRGATGTRDTAGAKGSRSSGSRTSTTDKPIARDSPAKKAVDKQESSKHGPYDGTKSLSIRVGIKVGVNSGLAAGVRKDVSVFVDNEPGVQRLCGGFEVTAGGGTALSGPSANFAAFYEMTNESTSDGSMSEASGGLGCSLEVLGVYVSGDDSGSRTVGVKVEQTLGFKALERLAELTGRVSAGCDVTITRARYCLELPPIEPPSW